MPDAKARLEEREGCFLRKTYKPEGVTGRVKAMIDKERKDMVIENLTKKYGTVTIGIHGQELPKYSEKDETKEFWKNNKDYRENPTNNSLTYMKQSVKYWAQDDKMKLADVSDDLQAAPIDPFKVEHIPQKFKFGIAPHVHQITHWKAKEDEFVEDTEKEQKGHLKQHNWSELEKMFRCEGTERLLDKIVRNAENYQAAIEES